MNKPASVEPVMSFSGKLGWVALLMLFSACHSQQECKQIQNCDDPNLTTDDRRICCTPEIAHIDGRLTAKTSILTITGTTLSANAAISLRQAGGASFDKNNGLLVTSTSKDLTSLQLTIPPGLKHGVDASLTLQNPDNLKQLQNDLHVYYSVISFDTPKSHGLVSKPSWAAPGAVAFSNGDSNSVLVLNVDPTHKENIALYPQDFSLVQAPTLEAYHPQLAAAGRFLNSDAYIDVLIFGKLKAADPMNSIMSSAWDGALYQFSGPTVGIQQSGVLALAAGNGTGIHTDDYLAAAALMGSQILLWQGNANTSPLQLGQPTKTLFAPAQLTALAVADIDRNGTLDLVGISQKSILWFTALPSNPMPSGSTTSIPGISERVIAPGDWDGDGNFDFLLLDASQTSLLGFDKNGAPLASSSQGMNLILSNLGLDAMQTIESVTIYDKNNDGLPDLLLTSKDGMRVIELLNTSME